MDTLATSPRFVWFAVRTNYILILPCESKVKVISKSLQKFPRLASKTLKLGEGVLYVTMV